MKLAPTAYPNTNSHPTWSPDSRQVIAEVGSDTVIASRDNASEQDSFSPQPTWVNYPDWSPQGDKIAFSAHVPREAGRPASWGVYLCDPDGGNFQRILNDAREPEFNPQGTRIAYQLVKGGVDRLAIANADGSGDHPVSKGGLLQNDWSWDPKGEQVTYETYNDGVFQLRITDTTGKKDRLLSDGEGGMYEDRTPEWSPKGDKILFERHDRVIPHSDLWTIEPTTGKQRQLTSFPGRVYDATWSPDGSKIAFISNMTGGDEFDLYVMDADGQNVKAVSTRPGDEYAPRWSPDGTAIAFTRLDWGKHDEGRYSLHIHEF
ncbi:MAG: PD40 domain-containing protein [Candidatus Eremiobacteraeota bacterium]|nr:PD40 domain-containing protein [Candidatus Eremiobacteraeota bacterium]